MINDFLRHSVQVEVVPKGYEKNPMASKGLAAVLPKFNEAGRKNNTILRFNLPEALNGLTSLKGPQPFKIAFFPDGGENHEALRRALQIYFPRELVDDVTIDGESIYPAACS